MRGRGPTFVRHGGPRGRVVYLEEDVEAYLRAHRFSSTAEEAAAAAADGR